MTHSTVGGIAALKDLDAAVFAFRGCHSRKPITPYDIKLDSDIRSDDSNPKLVPAGSLGRIDLIDHDGDFKLVAPGLRRLGLRPEHCTCGLGRDFVERACKVAPRDDPIASAKGSDHPDKVFFFFDLAAD